MKVFSGSANSALAQAVAEKLSLKLSEVEDHVFPDGERRVRILDAVAGEDVVIVQPTSPPVNENYMELYFLVDAAKRSGAKSVTAVVSYLGYSRQDHVFREGEARSLEAVIRMLEASGATKVIGFDFHSIKIPEIFHIPVAHLSALTLFAKEIRELAGGGSEEILRSAQDDKRDHTLVSPDMGGIRRVKQLSEMLAGMPNAAIEKNRDLDSGEIASSVIHGNVGKNVYIVDDMISSGKTIAAAAKLLKENGVEKIYVFATHAIFSSEAPTILQESDVEKVFVTDTVFVAKEKQFEKLQILSVADLLVKELLENEGV